MFVASTKKAQASPGASQRCAKHHKEPSWNLQRIRNTFSGAPRDHLRRPQDVGSAGDPRGVPEYTPRVSTEASALGMA